MRMSAHQRKWLWRGALNLTLGFSLFGMLFVCGRLVSRWYADARVVFVIDTSASVGSELLDRFREVSHAIASALEVGDSAVVVEAYETADVKRPLWPPIRSSDDQRRLHTLVDSLTLRRHKPDGMPYEGTDLAAAVARAWDELGRRPATSRTTTFVVFLTDGAPDHSDFLKIYCLFLPDTVGGKIEICGEYRRCAVSAQSPVYILGDKHGTLKRIIEGHGPTIRQYLEKERQKGEPSVESPGSFPPTGRAPVDATDDLGQLGAVEADLLRAIDHAQQCRPLWLAFAILGGLLFLVGLASFLWILAGEVLRPLGGLFMPQAPPDVMVSGTFEFHNRTQPWWGRLFPRRWAVLGPPGSDWPLQTIDRSTGRQVRFFPSAEGVRVWGDWGGNLLIGPVGGAAAKVDSLLLPATGGPLQQWNQWSVFQHPVELEPSAAVGARLSALLQFTYMLPP